MMGVAAASLVSRVPGAQPAVPTARKPASAVTEGRRRYGLGSLTMSPGLGCANSYAPPWLRNPRAPRTRDAKSRYAANHAGTRRATEGRARIEVCAVDLH